MTAALPIVRAPAAEVWRPHLLALGAAAAAILILFAGDAGDMAQIWWTSSTFTHCLFIPPILAWLVWQRLPELKALSPRAWPAALGLVAAGAASWLLGEAGGVALFRHVGLVLMLQGSVAACLGKAVMRGLAFPLFYALFLVPFGEELVPPMQVLTAKMSMALLALTAVPAHIEGIFISTPAGLFRVAEACSGVKFLVAMAALSALVANLCFRSWRRRIPFLAAAMVIPILANGIRAWGTIFVAQRTGAEAAAGFDHIVYGWIFFGLVIALLMGGAWRFFDRGPTDPWFDPAHLQPTADSPGKASDAVRAGTGAVVLAALAPVWLGLVAAAGAAQPPAPFLPDVPGWQRVAGPADWQPHYSGADRISLGRYSNPSGRVVDLALVVFARQSEGRELVGYGQGASDEDGAWSWIADTAPPRSGKAERISSHEKVREVATFYRVGILTTGSASRVKLETIRTRLLGGPQRAVAVLVSAEAPAAGISPRPAIDAFLAALGPVDALADRAAGLQD
ncbi:MAG TPA: exosortase A [Allosphingosinicella sp.]|nr:exosortase A [Allosphingosinicella sp.]